MEAKKSNPIKVFLYISVWVIIWGTVGSLVDFPLYKNKIYLEGSIYQYLLSQLQLLFLLYLQSFFIRKLIYKNLYLNVLIIFAGSLLSLDS